MGKYTWINLMELRGIASNLLAHWGNNPSYSKEDFLAVFPQFKNKVPDIMIDYYINLANACLSYNMYGEQWNYAMSLYVAHFLTLYLKLSDGITEDSPVSQVIRSSLGFGLVASKSAGDLSLSYDYGAINEDLNGWAAWKMTTYGQLFATIAKLVGKAGSYIW